MAAPHYEHFHSRALRTVRPSDAKTSGFARAEAALLDKSAASAGARELKWVRNLWAYELFFQQHGRAPRERTRQMITLPPDERRLGEWASRQRRHRGGLDRYQEARLTASRAFQWDMQSTRWLEQAAVVWNVVTVRRRFPRTSSTSQWEAAAARWWARQLRAALSQQLTSDRAELVHLIEIEAARLGVRRPRSRKTTSH